MSIDKALEEALRVFQHVGGLNDKDKALLKKHGADLLPFVPEITTEFYKQLMSEKQTAKHIESRVDSLKTTHIAWITSLLSGNCDNNFMETQLKIGVTHVAVGIPPLFVASSMSYLRFALAQTVTKEFSGSAEVTADLSSAIVKILDLSHFLIDYAYEKDRLKRLTQATGLSLPLLESLIALKPSV